MTDVLEINDIRELASYRAVWLSLLEQTKDATFFQSLEWLESYWKHYGQPQKLRVLLVRQDNQITGIVPLVVRTEQKYLVRRYRRLTFPMDDWGSFYGPIGPQPAAALQRALEHVRETPRDWDLIDFSWTPDAGQDPAETGSVMQRVGYAGVTSLRAETAIVDLAGTWQDYLATRTSKWRNNFRRWQRRLGERGEIRYVRHRPAGQSAGDADPRWDLYGMCEQLANRCRQGESGDGTTLCHASVRPFLRDVHEQAAITGALDMNLLYLGDQPMAFVYAYHFGGRVYGLRAGCDAELGRDGAGNLLYTKIIKDSYVRGDRVLDMGPGSLRIKRHLISRVEPVVQQTYYHPVVLLAQLVRVKRWADERRRQANTAS